MTVYVGNACLQDVFRCVKMAVVHDIAEGTGIVSYFHPKASIVMQSHPLSCPALYLFLTISDQGIMVCHTFMS